MKSKYIYTSLTRISDLERSSFTTKPLSKANWNNGDYVVCKVINSTGGKLKAELPSGRMIALMQGDIIIGALGIRHATLEATGHWKSVGRGGIMHLLTGAGLMGKLSSKSVYIPNLIELQYIGHVIVQNHKSNMLDYVPLFPKTTLKIPIILIVGTSMSAGKTTVARLVTRQLKHMNLDVVGAKLTGAGRYRDILAMKDAGADWVFDFVDVGLPSSIVPIAEYRKSLEILLSMIASTKADVGVIEIGASPLEPYNGTTAIKEIRKNVRCKILCASDPYAVYGVMKSYSLIPDLVSGIATNTIAGRELIKSLCKVEALNLIDYDTLPALRQLLKLKLMISSQVNSSTM